MNWPQKTRACVRAPGSALTIVVLASSPPQALRFADRFATTGLDPASSPAGNRRGS